ncbi:hypothetical protein KL86CLO1_11053 [uncultured Eubacteriales bacterium]|uniref:Uncharacterized protein n=1 Tax=uncultured Eubacteriales bacterium TaxID=172733 RepID=A0A212JGH9_9FIRM|nr:hypothetical protein KL86CLO1_11053 [uncultured Eubacteriales bacterium]
MFTGSAADSLHTETNQTYCLINSVTGYGVPRSSHGDRKPRKLCATQH